MALPNPNMNFDPLQPLPAESLNNIVENIEALADGNGIDDSSITAKKLATSSLVLGYAQRTTGFSFGSVVVDNPGLSVTFTTTKAMPVSIEFWAAQVMTGQSASTRVDSFITDGSNNVLAANYPQATSSLPFGVVNVKKSYSSLPAGTYTFKVRHVTPAGTGTLYAGPEAPAFIKAYIG